LNWSSQKKLKDLVPHGWKFSLILTNSISQGSITKQSQIQGRRVSTVVKVYETHGTFSSKLLHQLHQLEQVFVAKEASAVGYCDKGIRRHYGGPTRGNGAQLSLAIIKVDPVLAPVVAIRDQLELLAPQRMVRMDYFEVGIGNVTMRCS